MRLLIVTILSFLVMAPAFADDFDEVEPVIMDVSVFEVTKKQARTATLKALHLKKWNIISITDDEIKMSYNAQRHLAKVDLSKFPVITLVNTEDTEDLSVGYLEALRRNIYADLVSCMK